MNTNKKKVLVIDDDVLVCKSLKRWLDNKGYEAFTATSGIDGIKIAETTKLDLIFLDILMPGMDGHQVIKQLKKLESTKSVPVMMLTCRRETDDIIKSLIQEGAMDYIVKPFFSEELLNKLGFDVEVSRVKEINVLFEDIDVKLSRLF